MDYYAILPFQKRMTVNAKIEVCLSRNKKQPMGNVNHGYSNCCYDMACDKCQAFFIFKYCGSGFNSANSSNVLMEIV